MGEHTDYGIVTVLWADPVAGLQILRPDGAWHDGTARTGALLVNLGDLTPAGRTSAGGPPCTESCRRGVDGGAVRRRSAADFHDGNVDAVISTFDALPSGATRARLRGRDGRRAPGPQARGFTWVGAQPACDSRGGAHRRHGGRAGVTTIPLIDLARWFEGDADERAELARDVDTHLRRLGFLLVVGHRVPQHVIDDCREQSRLFFHLPAAEKAAMTLDGWRLPWMGRARAGVERGDVRHRHPARPQRDVRLRAGRRAGRVAPDAQPAHVRPEPLAVDGPPGSGRRPRRGGAPAGQLADELLDLCSLALALPQPTLRDRCRGHHRPGVAQLVRPARCERSRAEPVPGRAAHRLRHADRARPRAGSRRTPGQGRGGGLDRRPPRRGRAWSSTPAT